MLTSTSIIENQEVLTVYQLNNTARRLLETHLRLVWVKGELSNVAAPRSGHLYFTLKDSQAQIRCAMFKMANRKLNFVPEEGTEVLLQAAVSIYEERGDYQLIVSHMEKAGLGQLQQAYEELKNRLAVEGLFDAKFKKSLPRYPKHIGIITSHTGAALQDILSVLKRRYPIAPITVYHTQVQGKSAANEIIQALAKAQAHQQADVLILARGGGSLEDLWCFNEEKVARAIFACSLPVVTGIGHEIDFTIADFVADLRAPTPSAAAESISPDSLELLQVFSQHQQRLTQAMQRHLMHAALKIDNLEKRLVHPKQHIEKIKLTLSHLWQRCQHSMQQKLAMLELKLAKATGALHTISPLATLNRGYSITTLADSGNVIRDAKNVALGQEVETRVANGSFKSVIQKISEKI